MNIVRDRKKYVSTNIEVGGEREREREMQSSYAFVEFLVIFCFLSFIFFFFLFFVAVPRTMRQAFLLVLWVLL